MTLTFEVRTLIQRPIAEVFAFFRDIDQHAGVPGSVVPVYDKLTPGPPGVGTRYREVIQLTPWQTIENESEISEFVPPTRLAAHFWFRSGLVRGTLRYDLTDCDGGTATAVVQRQTLKLRGPLRLLSPVIRATFARRVRWRIEGIRRLLESAAVAGEPTG